MRFPRFIFFSLTNNLRHDNFQQVRRRKCYRKNIKTNTPDPFLQKYPYVLAYVTLYVIIKPLRTRRGVAQMFTFIIGAIFSYSLLPIHMK